MNTKLTFGLITVLVAVPAFFLGNIIWPASPEIAPTSGQMPFFIILAALEAIVLGVGVAVLVLRWPQVDVQDRIAFLAVIWLLVSWWPHDNMHKHNGLDITGLLVIEYLFHVTVILSGLILARYFWQRLGSTQSGPATTGDEESNSNQFNI